MDVLNQPWTEDFKKWTNTFPFMLRGAEWDVAAYGFQGGFEAGRKNTMTYAELKQILETKDSTAEAKLYYIYKAVLSGIGNVKYEN